MSRVYLGSVFSLSGTPDPRVDGVGVQLRWMLGKHAGLPRKHFKVWVRTQLHLPQSPLPVTQVQLTGNSTTIEWGGEPMAALQLTVTVDATKTLTLSGGLGVGGGGATLDTVTASPGTTSMVVVGSGLRSATLTGFGRLVSATVVSMNGLLNDTGWTLYERVGMPVDSTFASSGYDMGKQGRVGQETDPPQAAKLRIDRGQPTTGWPATNDRNQAMPAWQAPPSSAFVDELRATVLPGVRDMLTGEASSDRHLAYRAHHPVQAPTSIHDKTMPGSASADVSPLGALFIAAASDPLAALGLGFGTFVPRTAVTAGATSGLSAAMTAGATSGLTSDLTAHAAAHVAAAGAAPAAASGDVSTSAIGLPTFSYLGLVMVTVEHTVVLRPPGAAPISYSVDLGDVYLRPVGGPVPTPANVGVHRQAVTTPGAVDPTRAFLDRPGAIDQPYLESVAVRWDRPILGRPDAASARSYALSRSRAGLAHELRLSPRTSGGHRPFVPARPSHEATASQIQSVDRGLPEPILNETPGVVYSVTGQDWFGRWSPWTSADYARVAIEPQVPALLRAELVSLGDPATTQDGAVDVELAWNWADRSPELICVEVKLHAVGTPPPTGVGAVKRVGAGLTAPLVLTFGGSPNLPAGVERLDDPSTGGVVRYRVRLTGFQLDFGLYPRIAASVRLTATEHVRPQVLAAWSRTLDAVATSRIPPAAPPPPPGMVWSALPDPVGVARASVSWTTSAGVSYVVYTADESAVRRELGLPAADMHVPPHLRLAELRGQSHVNARRAFRRLGDNVTASPFEAVLPKGSRAIHFYVVLAVSGTGIESAFPTASNSWIAIATPRRAAPSQPRLAVRAASNGVALEITVPPGGSTPSTVTLHRASRAAAALELDSMGPPLASTKLDTPGTGWQVTALPDGGKRITFVDATAPASWAPLWYRAVVWSDSDAITGVVGARSEPSAVLLTARAAAAAPSLQGGTTSRANPSAPVLVRWACALPRDRTPLGVVAYSVVGSGGDVIARRRAAADSIPTYIGALPPIDEAAPIFRHHATDPNQATFGAWLALPAGAVQVVVQVTDPAGRTATKVAS